MVLLYDPTAPQHDKRLGEIPKLDTLSGKVVGFVDNAKPNFDHLVEDLAQLLVEKHGVKEIIKRRKPSASIPVAPQVLSELAAQGDLIIAGSGD
ncbi:MAG TPA: hypothetical protein VFP00_01000 [Burkholderiales bacterium]|nr:hypothetical protein [Burkholderiales bacterium]